MRESWEEYFLGLARQVARRSTCMRRQIGAIAVREKRILATGYNGAPAGLDHCRETGCLREKIGVPSGERHELCRATHAEQNVICQAARFGTPLAGAGLYIAGGTPCLMCAKMLINVGIVWIITDMEYPDALAMSFLKQAGIMVEIMENNKEE